MTSDAADDPWDLPAASEAAGDVNPVGWDRAIGQTPAVVAMRAAVRDDTVPHAWLLAGEPGIGQDPLVTALTAALECEAEGGPRDEGCGTCSVCQRIARGTWSALATFEPEGSQHLVGAVRDAWLPAATRTGLEGRRRVLRIRAADRMNEQAQNAFLKVLEEPPAAVLWVLEVTDDTQLLDTIHSRVRRVDLAPWRPDELVEWAVAEPDVALARDEAAALARVAVGSPRRLRALTSQARTAARDANLDVLRRLVEEGAHVVDAAARDVLSAGRAAEKEAKQAQAAELEALPERYGVERASEVPKGVATALKERHKRELRSIRDESVQLFLDDLGSWLRDLVVLVGRGGGAALDRPAGLDGLVNRDRSEQLRRDADRFALPDLLEAIGAVERCRLSLERNGNAELQVTRLLLTLAGPAWEASRAPA